QRPLRGRQSSSRAPGHGEDVLEHQRLCIPLCCSGRPPGAIPPSALYTSRPSCEKRSAQRLLGVMVDKHLPPQTMALMNHQEYCPSDGEWSHHNRERDNWSSCSDTA
ncbi:unnamed protein product, partial [Ectocarpus sp. 8 AP-2014]